MSTGEMASFNEEEEQIVERIGGRGLVQVLLRVRRERAGRAPQNLQSTLDNWTRPQLQEVGPCGQEVGRRPGGLRVWGRQNGIIDSVPRTVNTNDKRQQTVPKETQERPRTRVGARARPSTPIPHPDFPMIIILLLWGTLWPPTDAPIVKTFWKTYFPCHPTL